MKAFCLNYPLHFGAYGKASSMMVLMAPVCRFVTAESAALVTVGASLLSLQKKQIEQRKKNKKHSIILFVAKIIWA